jgi:hypothetical protein
VKVNRRETLRDLTNIVNERLPWPVSTRTVRRRLKFHGFSKHVLACHDQHLLVFHLRILHVSNIIELTWQPYLCTNIHDFFGFLTEIEGNMNTTKYLETLGDNVWPVIAKIFLNGGYIFQDDNASCHASRRAVQWKRENELNCLNWPSQSPDLNIIENDVENN